MLRCQARLPVLLQRFGALDHAIQALPVLNTALSEVISPPMHIILRSQMRCLLLSIEFNAATFSGNGVYACSQVGSPAATAAAPPLPPPPPPRPDWWRQTTLTLPCGLPACLQARALTQLGHEVLVVAGAPPGFTPPDDSGAAALARRIVHVSRAGGNSRQPGGLQAAVPHPTPNAHCTPPSPLCPQVPLPVWGRLDAGCAWREFAAGAAQPRACSAVAAFCPEVVLGVDWHSVAAYEALSAALAGGGAPPLPPFVYLNYR